MSVPEVVHVTVEGRQMVHAMTDGVLVPMTVTEAQLFQVRLGKAIEAATAADIPQRGPDRPMTAKMNRKIHAQLGERGITGPARHAALSRMLGRQITSASELSFDDAMVVIDLMEREYPDRHVSAEEPF